MIYFLRLQAILRDNLIISVLVYMSWYALGKKINDPYNWILATKKSPKKQIVEVHILLWCKFNLSSNESLDGSTVCNMLMRRWENLLLAAANLVLDSMPPACFRQKHYLVERIVEGRGSITKFGRHFLLGAVPVSYIEGELMQHFL